MITITLTAEDLERIRFAFSPLDEMTMSYHVLRHRDQPAHMARWVDEARESLYDTDLPYMSAIILPREYLADFLTPTPTEAHRQRTIEDELAALRQLPNEIIRASVQRAIEIDGESEIRQQYMTYPQEVMECLIEELRLYWSRALSHHWKRINAVLENDMLYRARELALNGVEPILSGLSKVVTYERGTLTIHKHSKTCDDSYTSTGEGIYLSPSVFKAAGHGLSWQFVPEYDPMLIYGARGGGTWYAPDIPDPEEQLRMALGDAPARLLVALTTPDHTSNLAKRLFLTAGAVSQQLKRLNQAGLVEAHRSGYKVYYRLSERGSKLINLFEASA